MGVTAQSDHAALGPDEFIAKIWQERRRYVREGKIKQPHPWRVALSQGRVSRRALVEYVKNRYYFHRWAAFEALSDGGSDTDRAGKSYAHRAGAARQARRGFRR